MKHLNKSCLLVLAFVLNGCSAMKAGDVGMAKSDSLSVAPGQEVAGKGSGVGTFTKFNVIKSFSALVKTPISNTTKAAYYDGVSRLALLPVLGEPSSLNSPAMNFLMVAATEHCSDLVKTEALLAADKRQMMGKFDLGAKAANLTEDQFVEAGDLFAMSFWGRAANGDEKSATKNFYASLSDQNLLNTQKLVLVCAGELVSLASITR